VENISFGPTQFLESRSHNVYQYIKQSQITYGTVYFTSSSGAGYYTLLASHQGLICLNTTLVVGFETISHRTRGVIESGNIDYLVTDLNYLKWDYIQQRSLELAVSTLEVSYYY